MRLFQSTCFNHLIFDVMDESINPWQVLAAVEKYDNPWINVMQYDVINPRGGKGIYGKIHFKNIAVGIIPVDENGNTYLVGQYRFAINAYSWEIPEGGCPEGSDPLAAAKRELLEETGLVAGEWKMLMKMHLSNSVSDELAIVYLATQLSQQEAAPEETEQLQVRKISLEEAYAMVEAGTITDSMSVAGLLKTKLLLQHGSIL
jgi:8-oxo-dGTP pyrophosphatase MutT (NUDIX family)